MCNNDCWNCELEGCINLTNQDYKRQNDFDRHEKMDRKILTKRQESVRKYDRSYKGKLTKQRYDKSEKGREMHNKASKAYYQRNKEYVKDMSKRYIAANREKVNARRREYYQRNKEKIKSQQRLVSARNIWKKRFTENHGRVPTESEVAMWQQRYMEKIG